MVGLLTKAKGSSAILLEEPFDFRDLRVWSLPYGCGEGEGCESGVRLKVGGAALLGSVF